jgi:S-adenosylmethionine:tRNA ribosyltransferase-isomerase
LRLSDFDYLLPKERIAQVPLAQRDASRLMLVHRQGCRLEHRAFSDLGENLYPGDLLILNDTKVRPCRLRGSKEDSGGEVEVLLLREREEGIWEALLKPGSKVKKGQSLILARERLKAQVLDGPGRPRRLLRLDANGSLQEILREEGEMPLPPYIKRDPTLRGELKWRKMDGERYQTVFAKHEGAVAAPTAGLHFTPSLLANLQARGVTVAYLTLHVGPGTFQPVRAESISAHHMDGEDFLIPDATAEAVADCKGRGGRVIAAGTTTVRALESAASGRGTIHPGKGTAELFIYPGYRFRIVDALLTNFHLPRSTLLMLVSAFAGTELIRDAYREAIRGGYRFYSYGDAMLIV